MKSQRSYVSVLVIAVILRIAWGITVPVAPVSDSAAYEMFAQNIAEHSTFGWNANEPSTFWPPGTSFVYSTFFIMFGKTYTPIVIFHILISVFIVASSMSLAAHWFGRCVALGTGAWLAVWPGLIQFTTILSSELLFIALVQLALLIWVSQWEKKWLKGIAVGIVFAGACYVRAIALLLPLVLMFASILGGQKPLKAFLTTLVVLISMSLLILPWTTRNLNSFDEVIIISANGGANLWMGNNPDSTGEYMPTPVATKDMSEGARNRYLGQLALEFIKEEPVSFLLRSVRKLVILHERETIGVVWNEKALVQRFGDAVILPLKIISTGFWLLTLLAAGVGLFWLTKHNGIRYVATCPLTLLWIYYASVHAVIVAQDRYHFPSIPMIATFASIGILSIYRRHITSRGLVLIKGYRDRLRKLLN